MTCVIVDDEPLARNLLTQYVERSPRTELLAALPGPVEALAYLREHRPDVLFLDVQMPEITGIGLLKILQPQPLVVLTTAYSEYAIEGYALDVADYLLKPITFERFLQTVEKLHRRLTPTEPAAASAPAAPPAAEEPTYLFVKDGTRSVRVALADIQYIEGMRDYVRIHTPERKVTTLQTFKNLLETLPEGDFLRIHQSYLIGAAWLEEVRRDEVVVAGVELPVSDTYRAGVKAFVEARELR